jgi:DivIVA domain-containing protein
MSPLTAEDVRYATFGKPPWGKRGYNEDAVDDFLDTLAATITPGLYVDTLSPRTPQASRRWRAATPPVDAPRARTSPT